MSLAIDYCKEIARELQQTAVYIPGASVKPGDIIQFKRSGLFGPKPLGEFVRHGNLTDLGINITTEQDAADELDSYVYASKGSASASFEADANAGTLGKGKLTIGFSKEGSIYLSAVDCKENRFKSIIGLEDLLNPHKDKLDWKSHYIVISVTVAARALIMQSSSSTANLEISGSVKDLTPGDSPTKAIDANLDLKISKYKEASFIKDWSANVPVFFSLIRYRKQFLSHWDLNSKKLSPLAMSLNEHVETKNPYVIEVIDPSNLS